MTFDEFEENESKRVKIREVIVLLTGLPLWSHCMESTNHGIEYLSLMREGPRNAEVTHLDYYLLQVIGPLGVLEEGILRLDVAVHFLLVVDYTHSRDQLQEYSQVKLHVLRFAAVFLYEIIQVASYH